MFDRRGFLQTSCGLATIPALSSVSSVRPVFSTTASPISAEQNKYEQILAQSPDLELLGQPRNWSQVREGWHPFSPERVLILTKETCGQLAWNNDLLRKQVWEGTEKYRLRHGRERAMPEEKFDLLVTIADRFANYYQRPDLFGKLAANLVRREAFSASGLGNGLGLLHQFQYDPQERVATDNALVDWWLVLCPAGTNFECLDDKPAYVLVSHIFDRRRAGLELDVWALTCRPMLHLPFKQSNKGNDREVYWQDLAALDRVAAARLLNYELARCLQEFRGT